jgi:hypothetical protein
LPARPRLRLLEQATPLPNRLEETVSEIGDALAALWWIQTLIYDHKPDVSLPFWIPPIAVVHLRAFSDRLSQTLGEYLGDLRQVHEGSPVQYGDTAIESFAEYAYDCCSKRAGFLYQWTTGNDKFEASILDQLHRQPELMEMITSRLETIRDIWSFPRLDTVELTRFVDREVSEASPRNQTDITEPTTTSDLSARARDGSVHRSPDADEHTILEPIQKNARIGGGDKQASSEDAVRRGNLAPGGTQEDETRGITSDKENDSPWFDKDPPEDSKFRYGPIEGRLQQIQRWIVGGGTEPTLRKHNGKSFYYIRKLTGPIPFAVWFDSQRRLDQALTKKNETPKPLGKRKRTGRKKKKLNENTSL